MNYTCRLLLSIIGLASLVACASYPINAPLDEIDESSGYRMSTRTLGDKNSDETFVILALSGGGMRAAALDFGVMQLLDRVRFGDDGRTLLDEVDVISSASGGSIPAAYYGLYGKDVFLRDFKDDVLYRQIQSALGRRVLNPKHRPRLMSSTFSRSDLAVEYLDKTIFDGHTFADLQQQRPFILLNATDIGIGSQFSFVQSNFDLICSDLSQLNIARAVTASMAFTPGFTPITLKNYNDGRCGDTAPSWVHEALQNGVEADPSVFAAANDILGYQDIQKRPYIHLLDSGISDNLGIRTPTLALKIRDAPASQVDRIQDGRIEKLIVIVVNARPRSDFKGDLSPKPPKVMASVMASAARPIANYSYETVNLMRRDIQNARDSSLRYHEIRMACSTHAQAMCADQQSSVSCQERVKTSCFEEFGVTADRGPPDLDIYLVHLSFDLIDDREWRKRFETIPTKLELSKQDVDALIDIAPELLQQEPEFQILLHDLGAELTHR
jgi:NTE family protein